MIQIKEVYEVHPSITLLRKTVNNDIRIMNDCLKIINTSVNITTVVKRYEDLIVSLTRLASYEDNPNVSFEKELPSHALMRMDSEKSQIMNRAIKRSYDDVLLKCSALKDETSRIKRKQKFFDDLKSLMIFFPLETRDFANKLINKDLNNYLSELKKILDTDSNLLFSIND